MPWTAHRARHIIDLLALMAGAAAPLAFAPYGLYPVAILSLATLFVAWNIATPLRCAWRGWLYGLGLFGHGVFWISESFRFSNVPAPVAYLLTSALVVFLALYPTLLGALAGRLRPSGGTRVFPRAIWLVVLLPAAWVLLEWIRGWFLTGFTWLQMGYSQIDSPLAGHAALSGVYGVSWAVAMSAGLVAILVTGNRAWIYCIPALAALWSGSAYLRTIEWTQSTGSPLHVALIQGNVPQDQKWLQHQREPTLRSYLGLTRENWDADLVIWPETAIPGLYRVMEPFIAHIEAKAQRNSTVLIFGIPERPRIGERPFNSIVVLSDGQRWVYRKHHLVPFGEYLPLASLLGPIVRLANAPVANFQSGDATQTLPIIGNHQIGLSICYEVAFGEEIITALPEAALLVNLSNDAWFGRSIGPPQHLEIARMRALETGRYLLRATNTGITAIIDPRGEVESRLPQFRRKVLRGDVLPMTGATPYVITGNNAILIVLVVVFLISGGYTFREVNRNPDLSL